MAEGRSPYDRAPSTRSALAQELNFVAADPKRDVASRLRTLNNASGWNVSPGMLQAEGSPMSASPGLVASSLETLSVFDALRQSQRTGRELLSAQEDYILASIRLLQERHLWGPRFFNDTAATISGAGDDGDFQHALGVVNTLRATQRLPMGGEVEARWLWNATEQLREQTTQGYQQSSSIVLSGRVPLLRGAGEVAQEGRIQAERDLVYQARTFERFRRQYLVDIASEYFDLLRTRASIVNQQRQLDSLTQFAKGTQARVEAGRLEDFQRAITESQVKSAVASLEGLREQYTLQLDRFRLRIGLADGERFDLVEDVFDLPEPLIDQNAAAALALEYRLDLQNRSDQLDDTKRSLANAKDGLLPDLDVTGNVTLPSDPGNRNAGLSLSPGNSSYSAGISLSLPLDRKQEALNVRATQIRLERAERDYARAQDEVVLAARGSVRAVELARFQLNLAEQQVEINRRRLRGQQLQQETVQPQTIVDTENDLLRAENDRDRARATLRTSVLRYLLETDQLRVSRNGELVKLSGM